jgi:hypothetical protein
LDIHRFNGSVPGGLVPSPQSLSADLNAPRQRKKGTWRSSLGEGAGGEGGLDSVMDHGVEGESSSDASTHPLLR